MIDRFVIVIGWHDDPQTIGSWPLTSAGLAAAQQEAQRRLVAEFGLRNFPENTVNYDCIEQGKIYRCRVQVEPLAEGESYQWSYKKELEHDPRSTGSKSAF